MNGLVGFKLCSLTDKELVEKVDQMTDSLFYDEKGLNLKVLNRNIPARPNEDYDLLVGELCRRFFEKL